MTQPSAEWHLDTRHLGRRVLVYDCLDSTNNQAAILAADAANDGIVVLAREQTAGRGQHGRTWLCPAESGVLLSVVVFPPPHLYRPVLLTAWAAVAVCGTVHSLTGLQAQIKWPNDVLLSGRKVCGILIEQAHGTVAGIGLNVNQGAEDLAAAGLTEATSLGMVTGGHLDWETVARLLIGHLDEEYHRLCQGDVATLEACWKKHLGLLGKPVLAECHEGTYRGRLRELGWDGVELEVDGGQRLRLLPERVRHLRPT